MKKGHDGDDGDTHITDRKRHLEENGKKDHKGKTPRIGIKNLEKIQHGRATKSS